ncbi:Tim44 domain-containing protein [Rubrivivax sp. A210]|uniref:Tim44 domain-containing protein n=1 Tax=Rubrivivax sp. A210 TaxID=2772301 RepID=UPI001F2FE18A|nr:TIM44-like domain-containing protein [Rubrivivax sp. A210]
MKKNWLIGALIVTIAATALPTDSEAKRLGGGKSSGLQRDMPARTSPDATPGKPATPAQGQQAAPATAPAQAGAAAATPPKRSWMGPLAGLAAGLGIAALLSHFGMGEAAANFLMMALLAAAAVFLVVWLLRRFGPARAATPALAGAGAAAGGGFGSAMPRTEPQPMQRTAYAEPAAPAPLAADAPLAATAPAAAAAVTRAFVPASFDSEGFARTAKLIFIRLQAANDSADLDDLRRFTTPELFAEIRLELQERGPSPQQTDVVKVETEVLDVVDEGERQIVSVRFHGQVVEEKGAAATDFDEVWHLVKPLDDSRSWAIAGIEQYSR